jgi:prepilin peptidase CpaA
MTSLIRLSACVALLILAAWDIRYRRLPNGLVVVVGGLYILDALTAGDPAAFMLNHLLTALATFAIGFGLFALGLLGGGDVKLAAALFLWTGTPLAWPVLLLISAIGLPIAMFSLFAAWIVKRRRHCADNETIGARHHIGPCGMLRFADWWSAKRGVPYGVALALGGGAGMWLPVMFHLPRF